MSRPIRQQLLLRVALALGAVALCVSVAGVLAARQEASQRLGDSAAAAKSVFRQSLAMRTRRVHGRTERAKAFELAAADASRATGTQVSLGAPAGGGRIYSYPIAGGRRLSVVV